MTARAKFSDGRLDPATDHWARASWLALNAELEARQILAETEPWARWNGDERDALAVIWTQPWHGRPDYRNWNGIPSLAESLSSAMAPGGVLDVDGARCAWLFQPGDRPCKHPAELIVGSPVAGTAACKWHRACYLPDVDGAR